MDFVWFSYVIIRLCKQAARDSTLRRRPKLVDAWPDGIFVKVMSGLPAPRPLFRIGCCGFSDPTRIVDFLTSRL